MIEFWNPTSSEADPLAFPTTSYAKTATTLDFYGKTADGVPLLQYPAYYQAIEHFWPTFVTRAAVQRVRNELVDPRFDRRSDTHIQKLIRVASLGALGTTNEPDQLLKTLEGSLNEDDLREVLEVDPATLKFLSLHERKGRHCRCAASLMSDVSTL